MARQVTHLINPCGAARPPRYRMAGREPLGRGPKLGLLDNGKSNSDRVLRKMGEVIAARFGLEGTVMIRKPAVAHPCPDALLDQLAEQCAAVVNGIGD